MEEIKRLNHAINILRSDLSFKGQISELSTKVGLSSSYLNQLFKKNLGETPGKFLKRHRLRRAVQEIRYRKDSVMDIGMEYGFESATDFTRSVKQAFNLTPTDIQKGANFSVNDDRKERFFRIEKFKRGMACSAISEIEIRNHDAIRLGYLRVLNAMEGGGSNPEESLIAITEWAIKEGIALFNPFGPVGICYEDFDLDHYLRFIYDAGIVLPVDWEGELMPGMNIQMIPAGKYAVVKMRGDLEAETDTLDYFSYYWLPHNKALLDDRPHLEVFVNESSVYDWSDMRLELHYPIRNI
ncbi:MAG: AraC family transcriptional regulator [Bacteriovoracaceae bacterium]|nr:AraC family transcriptional regulator [Bacteriovoracaceae bacterium]